MIHALTTDEAVSMLLGKHTIYFRTFCNWEHYLSLFVLTTFLNTVQSDGVQVVPLIQLLDMYLVKGCKVTGTLRWRRVNIGRISFSGRKGSIFLMKWKVPRS